MFVVSRAQIQRKSDQKDKLDPEKQPALEESDLKLSEGESSPSGPTFSPPPQELFFGVPGNGSGTEGTCPPQRWR